MAEPKYYRIFCKHRTLEAGHTIGNPLSRELAEALLSLQKELDPAGTYWLLETKDVPEPPQPRLGRAGKQQTRVAVGTE